MACLSLTNAGPVSLAGPRGGMSESSSSCVGRKWDSSRQTAVKRRHAGGARVRAAEAASAKLVASPKAGSGRGRVAVVVCNATYKVKLITPGGQYEIDAPDDAYLLDTAEECGVDLPFSCRAGSCAACAGKIEQGQVDQSEGVQLSDEQMDEGFLLTCISYPRSDLVIRTHKENDLM